MQLRQRQLFTTIRTEGALLPADLLQRLVASRSLSSSSASERDPPLKGLAAEDYHLVGSVRLNETINQSWNRLQGAWTAFQTALAAAPAHDAGTTLTRERWLLPLFQELGYGRLTTAKAIEITRNEETKTYSVSHGWQQTPIHLVSAKAKLDERTAGVTGAARISPHGLVQELLNRSEAHLWGFVSNGLQLRILRDNVSLTRQAYVEFDLEAMFNGALYADFTLLWLLCHQSRVELNEGQRPESCWLEQWSKAAHEQGTRALEALRIGVEEAIKALGRGFLAHPANQTLLQQLRSGALDKQDYYRQLLRLVYRLLFLFVAEDRDLLLKPTADEKTRERYARFYSLGRLRRLAERRRGTPHHDLYHGLRLVMQKLGNAQSDGCDELGLPALGSFLFSNEAIAALNDCQLANADLLETIRALAFINDGHGRRTVDYQNLRSEELGSVYEALLELHPLIHAEARQFTLASASGNERKTTGSYYTPDSLVQCLLDSALDPVVAEAVKQPDPEAALLRLKVVDPACGSGHFLIAAAHRLSKHLAAIRTGDGEPAPAALRTALRDVIGHCIYGVDLNPMAVELCKVSLWMEALEPGKPLSFLEHRILHGNALLGVTPALLKQGIPDEAFKPIEGDDKAYCAEFKKQNKKEHAGFQHLPFEPFVKLGNLAASLVELDAIDDTDISGIRAKQQRYESLVKSSGYLYGHFLADTWCAAFVWKKTRTLPYPITEKVFRDIEKNPYSHGSLGSGDWLFQEVKRLREQYQFFHWHLAFPDVFGLAENEAATNEQAGWSGGFDVVLGNPPWERIKLQEKEWFAQREPAIANAPNAAARQRMIRDLKESDPTLYGMFLDDRRQAEGESHLVRNSARYPLCGLGDINTYAIFAETNRMLMSARGRVGCIVPSGIATDDTTKAFFQAITARNSLVSLYDFQSGPGLFAEVGHARFKFCLLTLAGAHSPHAAESEFTFFLRDVRHLVEAENRFTLSAADIALLNPNTRTCPVFRTRRDAELTKAIYARVPVLIREATDETEARNPWGISFMRMLDMANDSGSFQTREELASAGWQLRGNVFERPQPQSQSSEAAALRAESECYLPLYEAKMLHHYDHRYGDYTDQPADSQNTSLPDVPVARLQNPAYVIQPRYWVPAADVIAKTINAPPELWTYWRLDDRTNVTQIIGGWLAGYFLNRNDEARGKLLLQKLIGTWDSSFDAFGQWLGVQALESNYPLTEAEVAMTKEYDNLMDYAAALLNGRKRRWLMGWRDICRSTDERTVIASAMPCVGVGDKFLLINSKTPSGLQACLLGNLDSFILDFNARQKVGGTSLKYFTMRQFPVLSPETYQGTCAWSDAQTFYEWIAPRVLELTYTAYDLRGFAEDCGYAGEPFQWPSENDAARRFLLRCELDAAYFHLYGIAREDVSYILDTFPIVKRKDEKDYGEYRTQRVILESYDRMQQAITTGQPYQTPLDPPPAHGWTPPPIKDEGGKMKDEVPLTAPVSGDEPFPLQMQDARPQPTLFDGVE